ncbi:MAG: hypothetical protein LBS49_05230 [Candidatus Accumulibacter sp.]|jgi:hypothetical protein|nr:hypothetical protein [Accumulibacter sp.]
MPESAPSPAISAVKPTNPPKIEPGQCYIRGKIVSRTKLGKVYVHVVAAPSVDEYSYPRSYEISSKEPLGEIDDVIGVKCDVTGRRAQKTWPNPETGEVKKFPGAYCGLRASED